MSGTTSTTAAVGSTTEVRSSTAAGMINTNSTTITTLQTHTTTSTPATRQTLAVTPPTTPHTVIGIARLNIRFLFITIKVPSETEILNIANKILGPRVRSENIKLNDPVQIKNITYEKLSNTSFALDLGYEITNVNMSEQFSQRNNTFILIQESINKLLNNILNSPNGTPFTFPQANFINEQNVIEANMTYIYKEGDINQPSNFLSDILKASGLDVSTTTTAPTTTTTTPPTTTKFNPTFLLTTPLHGASSVVESGKFPGWALAIIIPCGIVIILIPLWILLCCLLCGCCAAIRRRWRRRRSYNVQYTTRNGLF
ncbi:putative uncharacterized protein F40H6.5 [Scleropages formosus]|uniref:putative uncharacterized protein F40H6.5 n=1 Tax=Scleropages formosus TaxID=113540 RepID=UPI0010FAB643|nr:putative uncharacterized protein F40H6.5 [Scleropages formosus]